MSGLKVLVSICAVMALSVCSAAWAEEPSAVTEPADVATGPLTNDYPPSLPADAPVRDGKIVISGNDFPPGDPVPDEPAPKDPSTPPDDSRFFLIPAPEYFFRTGPALMADNKNGAEAAGGVGAMLFLDARVTAVRASVDYTQGKEGGAIDADVRARFFTTPLDKKHLFWVAFAADVAGRGSWDPRLPSTFRARAGGYIGAMYPMENKDCVFHIYAKGMLAPIDIRTQIPAIPASSLNSAFDIVLRPATGVEALAHCDQWRAMVDYEHVFAFSPGNNYDVANAQVSHTWKVPIPVIGDLQMGFFVKGRVEGMQARPGFPENDARNVFSLFGGLEVRPQFKRDEKKKAAAQKNVESANPTLP